MCKCQVPLLPIVTHVVSNNNYNLPLKCFSFFKKDKVIGLLLQNPLFFQDMLICGYLIIVFN